MFTVSSLSTIDNGFGVAIDSRFREISLFTDALILFWRNSESFVEIIFSRHASSTHLSPLYSTRFSSISRLLWLCSCEEAERIVGAVVAVEVLHRLCWSQVLSMVVNSLSFLCLDHIISNIGRVDILTRKSLYLLQKRQDSGDLNLAKYKL